MAFQPTVLTVSQLAERWQVSDDLIRQMVNRGELPCARLGRLLRIPLLQVEQREASWRDQTGDTTSDNLDPETGKSPGPNLVVRFDPEARARRIARALMKS